MIVHGDCLEVLKTLDKDSLDSLVTDVPAGISFMGKDWDKDKGGRDEWIAWMTEVMRECHRVLKPGAHGLVWAIPRTSHWTATALENAGFEVRDVVTHLFGTGFPKSLDISKAIDKAAGQKPAIIGKQVTPYKVQGIVNDASHEGWHSGEANKNYETDENGYRIKHITAPATDAAKQWQGWGTALKPASEHWILVRKPCSEKTVAANVLKHGTGGLNIDASRIAASAADIGDIKRFEKGGAGFRYKREELEEALARGETKTKDGRSIEHALNYIGTAHAKQIESMQRMAAQGRFPANLVLDEEAAAMLDTQVQGKLHAAGNTKPAKMNTSIWESGGALEKDINFNDFDGGASRFFYVAKASKSEKGSDNTHPTVKSLALMKYLIILITPPGGVVLDPFAGSGSTLVAAKQLGFEFIGIEKEAEYLEIARRRLGEK